MVSAELMDQIGKALFGLHYKPQLAGLLDVDIRRVQSWCSGSAEVPHGVWRDLADKLCLHEVKAEKLAIAARRASRGEL